MTKIWIIGMGKFGLIAFLRLSKGNNGRHFMLVDPEKENLIRGKAPNSTLVQADGVVFVEKNLDPDNGPDWIIPALPLHLAAEWLLLRLGPKGLRRVELPREMESVLPNPFYGPEGNIYVTHADFKCPDDCAEPREMCTVTGEPRKKDMFEILGNARIAGFQSINIRSHQLGPGIGGYRPKQLFDVLAQVEQERGRLAVSTACRCHGVITGLERL